MPNYEYRCPQCDLIGYKYFTFAESDTPVECPTCNTTMQKVLGIAGILRTYDGGFNPTIGGYVPNMRKFKDELKIASEQATLRTGIPHDFKPIDLNDHEACGIDDETLESVKRRNRRLAGKEAQKWL